MFTPMTISLKVFYRIYEDKRMLLGLLFFISLLSSLSYLFFFREIGPEQHKIPGTDYLLYYQPVAEEILGGRGIPFQENLGTRYPPGFSFILSFPFSFSRMMNLDPLSVVIFFNILMTAFSTMFGMLPTLIFQAEGSELYRGMAVVNVFGMGFGTFLTLVVTPILVRTFLDMKKAGHAWN